MREKNCQATIENQERSSVQNDQKPIFFPGQSSPRNELQPGYHLKPSRSRAARCARLTCRAKDKLEEDRMLCDIEHNMDGRVSQHGFDCSRNAGIDPISGFVIRAGEKMESNRQ